MEVLKIFSFIILIQYGSTQFFTSEQLNKIDNFINNAIACRSVPGLTFGIVQNDTTWTKGFGYANVEKKTPVESNTLFGIASLTKAFTATLLAIQLDKSDKGYTWDTKVSEILGKDFKLDSDLRTKETTIKDLLSHRTGLQSGDVGIFTGFSKNVTFAKLMNFLQYLGSQKEFRDGFVYNNMMYALAGHLIEIMSGKTWLEELQSSILDPIGMTATKVLATNIAVDDERVATPYVMINNKNVPSPFEIYDVNPQQAAGAIASSANDMVKWMQVILNRGATNAGQVITKSETLKHAFDPQIPVIFPTDRTKPTFPRSLINIGYGYGWFIGNYEGYKAYTHSGDLHAYKSLLWIFPELKIGMYTNINGPGTSPDILNVIMSYVFDILMDKEPWLNTSTACTYPMPWSPIPQVPSYFPVTNEPVNTTEKFTGSYGHRLFGEAHITNDNGTLMIKLGLMEGILNTTTRTDFFILQMTGTFKFMSTFHALFSMEKDGKYQELRIVLTDVTVFERGVKWMTQPPASPPTTTPGDTNAASHRGLTLTVLILTISFVIF